MASLQAWVLFLAQLLISCGPQQLPQPLLELSTFITKIRSYEVETNVS